VGVNGGVSVPLYSLRMAIKKCRMLCQEALGRVNAALTSEYECRRRMLIKRLDVTVQSFGWSDRAKAGPTHPPGALVGSS